MAMAAGAAEVVAMAASGAGSVEVASGEPACGAVAASVQAPCEGLDLRAER